MENRNVLFWLCFLFIGSVVKGQQITWKEMKESDGFVSNYIYDIEEDENGQLWFGTNKGLVFFDGFRSNLIPYSSDSIQQIPVYNIFKITNDKYWLGTANGLRVFDLSNKTIKNPFPELTLHTEDIISLSTNKYLITCLKKVFIIKTDNDKNAINLEELDFNFFRKKDGPEIFINEFFEDNLGNLFISLYGFGIIKGKSINIGEWDKFNFITTTKEKNFLRCLSMKEYPGGKIIFNFSGEGLYIYNEFNNDFTQVKGFMRNEGKYTDVSSINISRNQLIASKITQGLYLKNLGNEEDIPRELSFSNLSDFNLIDNHISSIHLTSNLIILGTLGDGIKYAPLNNPGIKTYSLANKIGPRTPIYTLGYHNGNIFAGTSGEGIIRISLDQNSNLSKETYWKELYGNNLSSDSIAEIHFSSKGAMWIASTEGLNYIPSEKVDLLNNKIEIIPKIYRQTNKIGSLSSNYVNDIFEYKDGNIYAATQSGLNRFNPNSESFTNHQNSLEVLFSKNAPVFYADYLGKSVFLMNSLEVNDIVEGEVVSSYHSLFKEKGTMIFHSTRQDNQTAWFGTNKGLFKYDLVKRKIVPFDNQLFFKNIKVNAIKFINNKLWMGTSKGVMVYDVITKEYDQYTVPHAKGWPFFHYGAICTDHDGNVYFGTNRGIVQVKPKTIENQYSKTANCDIIFNNVRNLSKNEDISISGNYQISFEQGDLVAIELSLPIHHILNNVQLEYTLEASKQKWIPIDRSDPKIFINHISSGNYLCQIRVRGNKINHIEETSIDLEILKPVWLRGWAIAFYLTVILSIIIIYVRYKFVQLDLKQKLKIERIDRLNQQAINNSKLEFVSHISHEFRTPLTLILNDIDSIKASGNNGKAELSINKIEKNTVRLKQLVNELMDFKKLKSDGLRIAVSKQDIISFVRENTLLFHEIALKYKIDLSFHSETEKLETWFSAEQMEKILYNLISNALKFTETKGSIAISVNEKELDYNKKYVEIKVVDSGCGISRKYLDKIFDNEFLTTPKNNKNFQSSGIGLYLTKKLVELHHGTIEAKSESSKGATFTILLPVGNKHFEANQILTDSPKLAAPVLNYTKESISKISKLNKTDKSILVVEDNPSIRELLNKKLSTKYQVLLAKDGIEGFEIAKKGNPNLIITDLAMPKKNGLSLIKELKNNEQTNNIPIIVLTAFTSEEKQVQSLEFGADFYLSKPFSAEVLLGTVNNLLKSRTELAASFKNSEIEAKDIIHQLPNSEIVKRTISILQENLSNPDFSVDDLAEKLKVSRSHLYTKLGNITNYSPKEFIHIMRVRHAAKLLRKGDLRVNEVASVVGYYTTKNFRKYFKTYYGVSPSEYLKNL